MTNSEDAADDKSAASFLHEPWKEHVHKTDEEKRAVLRELELSFERSSNHAREEILKKWRKGLGIS